MIPGLIIKQVLKLALKGIISEKVIKTLVIKLVEILVKSTKNDLDDKLWLKVKEMLQK